MNLGRILNANEAIGNSICPIWDEVTKNYSLDQKWGNWELYSPDLEADWELYSSNLTWNDWELYSLNLEYGGQELYSPNTFPRLYLNSEPISLVVRSKGPSSRGRYIYGS